ncbi:MAG: RNA-binding S4 domain-containing protein [Paludibacteraceae bacterium]|nr:RNA-binding S4 domain-containing protein [Paludibacteraceae bacterium]
MKEELQSVRIDKWLWAVRLFKTRSMAADACKKGRIARNGNNLKPSHEIRVGDTIQVKRPPVTYSFKVLALSENRMGAKLVPGFMENVTPAEQLEILEMTKFSINGRRDRGTGRPTKRERRQLMDYIGDDDVPVSPEDVVVDDLLGFDFGFDGDDDDDEEDYEG